MGRWFRADVEGAPLLDAATGAEVARISASGLDLAAVVDHARQVGGPAIRALAFHIFSVGCRQVIVSGTRSPDRVRSAGTGR